jgi:excisionase family DNA binding protein
MLTRPEAAEYLGISVRTLDLWRADGQVPYHMVGPPKARKIKFKKEDLDRLIRRVEATSGPAAPSPDAPEPKRRRFGILRGRRDESPGDDA